MSQSSIAGQPVSDPGIEPGTEPSVLTGVWSDLVGQEGPVSILRRAVAVGSGLGASHAMTHAWLVTGPPGSGRSNAARAFAAALQCPDGGCGHCQQCRTALSGAHPDVTLVRTEQLSIGVDEVRELVRRAAMSPTLGRRQVLVAEDADRVTERGADALLKSVEEPASKTVWILCAPTAEDVVVTIRSRCRTLQLHTPTVAAVAGLLERRDGIDPQLADQAARASQGHIGRARALARNPEARERRMAVLQIPDRLTGLGGCLESAAELLASCTAEAGATTADLDAKERAELEEALGFGTKGAKPKQAAAAIRDLTDQQKARSKRLQRDAIDRALTELTAFYRDVLSVQTGSGAPLVNAELSERIDAHARRSAPESTLRRIDALLACREALETNVAPLLALEAMMVGLVDG
jgi:DNA polymerase-3 subunit delta'